MENKKIVNLKVNGIHCDGCASKIKKNLDTLNMNQLTDVNIKTGDVKIIFDSSKASLAEVKSKIIEAGFQIESIELE